MVHKTVFSVSILIPTYNSACFIGELLDSIIIQEGISLNDIQVIVTDDASQDTTVKVVETYKDKIPHLVINKNKVNLGITKNCNTGLSLCTGKYCIAIGGDDVLMPDRIASQLAWFTQNPSGVLCSSGVEVFEHESGAILGRYIDNDFLLQRSKNRIISQVCQLASSRFMFDREQCHDLTFDERTPVVSDWLFYNELLFRGDYGDTGKIGLRYRRHANNTTKSGALNHYLDDRLIAIDILLTDHPEVYSACKRQRSHTFYNFSKRLYLSANQDQVNAFLMYSIREDMTNSRPYLLLVLCNSWVLGTWAIKSFFLWKKMKLKLMAR